MSGRDVSPLIPLPSQISVESIQAALQSAAAIKAKLYDDGVEIVPQVFGALSELGDGGDVSWMDEADEPEEPHDDGDEAVEEVPVSEGEAT